MTTLFTLIGLFLGLAFSARSIYKRLERLRSALQAAWFEVDLQLGKRYEAANQLVQAAADGPGTDPCDLAKVSQTLSATMPVASPKQKAAVENRFQHALHASFIQSASCSNVEGRKTLAPLQKRLQEIENDLAAAVEYYNTIVRDYNATISYFPANLIATRFNFEAAALFPLDRVSLEPKVMEQKAV